MQQDQLDLNLGRFRKMKSSCRIAHTTTWIKVWEPKRRDSNRPRWTFSFVGNKNHIAKSQFIYQFRVVVVKFKSTAPSGLFVMVHNLWNDPYKDYNLTYSLRNDFKYDKLFNLEYLIPNLENYNLTYSIINDTLSSNLFFLQNNSELFYRKNSGYNLAQVG